MRAGRLRHKITIQTPTVTKDSYGGDVTTWTTYAQPWADFTAINGGESFTADQRFTEATHKARVRYDSGIDTTMQISYEGREYDILSALDMSGRRKELVIICKARGNG